MDYKLLCVEDYAASSLVLLLKTFLLKKKFLVVPKKMTKGSKPKGVHPVKAKRVLSAEQKQANKQRNADRNLLKDLMTDHLDNTPIINKVVNMMMKQVKENSTTMNKLIHNYGKENQEISQSVADHYINLLYEKADTLLERYGVVQQPDFTQELLEIAPTGFIFRTLNNTLKEKLAHSLRHFTQLTEWPKPRRAPRKPTDEQLDNAQALVQKHYNWNKETVKQRDNVMYFIASHSSGKCKSLSQAMAKQVQDKFPWVEMKPRKTSARKPSNRPKKPKSDIHEMRAETWDRAVVRAHALLDIHFPNHPSKDLLANYLVGHVSNSSVSFKKLTKSIIECIDDFDTMREKRLSNTAIPQAVRIQSNHRPITPSQVQIGANSAFKQLPKAPQKSIGSSGAFKQFEKTEAVQHPFDLLYNKIVNREPKHISPEEFTQINELYKTHKGPFAEASEKFLQLNELYANQHRK